MSKVDTIINYLQDKNLLNDEIRKALEEYKIKNSSNLKMPFGAHKNKTLSEIYDFKPNYLEWLIKQEFIQDKFTDIYLESKRLLLE